VPPSDGESRRQRGQHVVGRALAQRSQAPAFDKPLAVEHAENNIGVADVDG
jgi:hypothetical protein